MIPNNNLSVLPFYTSLDGQNAKKWWIYGRTYPLYTPAGYLPPFQLILPHYSGTFALNYLWLYRITERGGHVLVGVYTDEIMNAGIARKQFSSLGYDVIVFGGQTPVWTALQNGRYFLAISVKGTGISQRYYSEVFTVVNDMEPYLKLTWWDADDFVMDAGTIVYKYSNGTQFKNVIYLPSDLAKPEYTFEEEGETRDGYFFPTKQISEKRYRFNFLAPEYLLDVMRFIRMADFAEIEYHGQTYSLDTFLMTPTWEDEGDIAVVEAEFETATVAKKIGTGYIKSLRGDFNDDFNVDFDI